MYKCSVCGKEYKEKPEFCDCGNDDFKQIIEKVQPKAETNQPNQKINNQQNTQTQQIKKEYKSQTYKKPKKTLTDKDILSYAIFLLCIILSILSLIFIGKDTNSNNKPTAPNSNIEQNKTQTNIPDINTIWKQNRKITPVQTQKNNNEIKIQKEMKQTQPQQNKQEPKKTQTQQKTNNTTQKTQIKQTPQQTKQVPTKTVKQQANPTSNNTNTTTPTKTTQPLPNTIPNIKPVTINPTPQQTTSTQKKELDNYKIALRNKIASNINFGAIVGDGDCIVSFKISKSGELTNRTFSKLSENDSLNDNVYAGMMNTPAYNPPPEAYRNEVLKLSVKMYGGKFEVDLK